MKVLINGVLYKSDEVPVLIICDYNERKWIGEMTGDLGRFCSFPEGLKIDEVNKLVGLNNFTDEELSVQPINYKELKEPLTDKDE